MHLTVQDTAIPKLQRMSRTRSNLLPRKSGNSTIVGFSLKQIHFRTSLIQPVHAWTEANSTAIHRYTAALALAIVFIRNARQKKNGHSGGERPCSRVIKTVIYMSHWVRGSYIQKNNACGHPSYVQAEGISRVGDDVYLWTQIGTESVQCLMTYDQWHFQETTFRSPWDDLPDDLFPVEA